MLTELAMCEGREAHHLDPILLAQRHQLSLLPRHDLLSSSPRTAQHSARAERDREILSRFEEWKGAEAGSEHVKLRESEVQEGTWK